MANIYKGRFRSIKIEESEQDKSKKVYIYLVVDKSLVTKRDNKVYIPLVEANNNPQAVGTNNNQPPVAKCFDVIQDEDSDNYLLRLEDDNGLLDKIICIIDKAQSIYVEIEKNGDENIIKKIRLNF